MPRCSSATRAWCRLRTTSRLAARDRTRSLTGAVLSHTESTEPRTSVSGVWDFDQGLLGKPDLFRDRQTINLYFEKVVDPNTVDSVCFRPGTRLWGCIDHGAIRSEERRVG